MKTDVEKLDPTRVKLSVEVPFAELKPSLDKAYRRINGEIRIAGFRPGKAPQRVIDSRVGRGTVLQEAINEALPRLYGQAVAETEVRAVGQPDVEVTEIEDGDRLVFTAEVDVKPEFDLPSRDGLAATVPVLEVTDADVDEQLDALRERFGTQVTVERAAAEGDLVTLDLVARRDGEEVKDGRVTGQTYKVGSGTMVSGLDDALTGMSAGETSSFVSQLYGESAGQDADIEITVEAVKELQLPELDDEFAQLASSFDTVDEMRDDIRTRLHRVKQGEQLVAARDATLAAYLELLEVPIPQRLLDHELEHRRESIDEELRTMGLTREQYFEVQKTSEEELEADIVSGARTAITSQFVLDEVVRAEEVKLEEGELMQFLYARAQRSGIPPEQYVQQVVQTGNVQQVVGDVLRGKAVQLLVREATITDESGAEVDIAALESDLAGPDASTRTRLADSADSVDSADSADSAGSADSADSADEPSGTVSIEIPIEAPRS